MAIEQGEFQMFTIIRSFVHGFMHAPTTHRRMMRKDRHVRTHLADHQIDAMGENSFPASDPPSTY